MACELFPGVPPLVPEPPYVPTNPSYFPLLSDNWRRRPLADSTVGLEGAGRGKGAPAKTLSGVNTLGP